MIHSNSSNFSDIETQKINVVQNCLQKSNGSSDVSFERTDKINPDRDNYGLNDGLNDGFNECQKKLIENKGNVICGLFCVFFFGLIGVIIYEYLKK